MLKIRHKIRCEKKNIFADKNFPATSRIVKYSLQKIVCMIWILVSALAELEHKGKDITEIRSIKIFTRHTQCKKICLF